MAPSAAATAMSMWLPAQMKAQAISASVLHGPEDLRLETRYISPPVEGELQIAVKSTGICGSDVAYYKNFANGDLCVCEPLSLGHESSGTVVAVGPQVKGFKAGDRVALEVGVPCGRCGICRKGRYNLCRKMRFRSSAKSVPHFQGTLQEKINHPAAWCHKLPDNISFDAAALLEPLSVGIRAVHRANPSPGSTALVMGAGTVGMLTAAMALQSGCTSVTIADVDAGRVDYAIQRGFATHGFVVPRPLRLSPSSASISGGTSISSGTSSPSGMSSPSDTSNSSSSRGSPTPASSILDSYEEQLAHARWLAAKLLTIPERAPAAPRQSGDEDEDKGVDVAFECTGKEICMQTCLYATRAGGKVIMVGMGTPIQTVPMSVAHLREIDILGIFRYANTYATGIRLLQPQAGGRGPALPSLDDMVTHRFKGLAAAKDAFKLAGRTVDDDGKLVLKVIIEP
ncbi:putative L-iditol 2-dehydrogenase [Rosellinia necatrix]|uniref:Putative L-iditol 2-dehydrogenase n=1 Tax=Rosellinia necatrix TaxID=77044 RepID=A0A1S7UHJ9_ROSNE|nr:putative L-iditol 2-dehydrogenase [Rosellinia necatrix]